MLCYGMLRYGTVWYVMVSCLLSFRYRMAVWFMVLYGLAILVNANGGSARGGGGGGGEREKS